MTPLVNKPKKLYKQVCFSVYPGDNNAKALLNLDKVLVRPVCSSKEPRYQKLMQAHHYLGSLGKTYGNSLVCRHLEPSVDRIGKLLKPRPGNARLRDRLIGFTFSPSVCSTKSSSPTTADSSFCPNGMYPIWLRVFSLYARRDCPMIGSGCKLCGVRKAGRT